jgi:membrane-bound inhibitor of C-type lysozyme
MRTTIQIRNIPTMIVSRTAFAALIALAAATTPALAVKASYTCSSGTRLTADFSGSGTSPGNVILTIAGSSGKTTVPQVISADGGRYANDAMEFWIKGRSATLTRGGKSENCQTK